MTPEQGFRRAFAAFEQGVAGVDTFLAFYDEEVTFEDPSQRTHGRDALGAAVRRVLTHLHDVGVELHSVCVCGDELFATWTLRAQPRLGPSLSIEGSSHVRLRSGRAIYQRDYWDPLSALGEAVPVVGVAYRGFLKWLA